MSVIASLTAEFTRYKALAEAAIRQVNDEELTRADAGGSNSIQVLVRHLAGNLESRFADFRTSDGEKPWRDRDAEFEETPLTRTQLLEAWDMGWRALLTALAELTDDQLAATITIRRQPLRIDEALHRSLAHTAYHVGQIVYLAKAMRGDAWQCLSIPRGASRAHNQAARPEHAAAHAAHLAKVTQSPS